MKSLSFIFLIFCIGITQVSCENTTLQKTENPKLASLKLPEGFSISIFAEVENARSLAMGDQGTIFVGNRKGDKVYALQDEDGDGKAEKKYIITEGKNMPNGVAFYKGDLYVAEIDKIWKYENIEENLAKPPQPVLVTENYPSDEHHGWKYIAFGPDGKLYIPVGAPCNICDDHLKDPRYASITCINPDGTQQEIFAHGIRNTVGFDWHPLTKELWFTDNGRDMMGDNIPPDELNHAPQKDMNFGYPYCHAGNIPDPEFGKEHNCEEFTPPIQNLAPHTAALGMKFYTGDMFPATYQHQIFIAEHGSWNRSTPIGYRIMLVKLEDNKAVSYEPFIVGWLQDGKAWGRPVDILQMKDGSLLISDDFANLVYRVTYKK